MDSVLYFCHACRKRLSAADSAAAVARGESHSTACCSACAKAGKLIKDPAALENEIMREAQLAPGAPA
ncbi:MAG: hypothetical protein ABSE73_26095, partial [Planctomycetota bacterium]